MPLESKVAAIRVNNRVCACVYLSSCFYSYFVRERTNFLGESTTHARARRRTREKEEEEEEEEEQQQNITGGRRKNPHPKRAENARGRF